MSKIIRVKCPKCGLEFNYFDKETRPFCSPRCRDIDLGLWLNESYAIQGKEPVDEGEEEQAEPPYGEF